jgi:hypothetical protein
MTRKNGTGDMQLSTYRITVSVMMTGILIILISASLTSCSKEDTPGAPPHIYMTQGQGYISHDTTVEAGRTLKIGIRAEGAGANLTYFSVRFNDGTSRILLDTGMNSTSLVYNLDVIKTTTPRETWTFVVMDRNRVKDSVQIVLAKSDSSKWGKIRTMGDIVLGAQENTNTGSFFSLDEEVVMTLQQAYENQVITDMLYYYGQYEGTLASPNEAEAPGFFTGEYGIANWTVKNEMRYDTTMVTPEVFDLAANDSLILAEYEPTAGKKKGKYVQPGLVFSFRSPAGKLGLVKILEVIPMPAGAVKFSIKIQD